MTSASKQTKYRRSKITSPSLFEEIFIRSWWVVLFVLMSYAIYEKAVAACCVEQNKLEAKLHALQTQKAQALEIQKDLLVKINSQSDPAFVEMTLIKGLGLVPEGYLKVLFVEKE